jgi:hypothetical protein
MEKQWGAWLRADDPRRQGQPKQRYTDGAHSSGNSPRKEGGGSSGSPREFAHESRAAGEDTADSLSKQTEKSGRSVASKESPALGLTGPVFGKIADFGKKDSKEKKGISRAKSNTPVTESFAGVSPQQVGLEIGGLLPRPVTPCVLEENVGRESPTNEIAHMEIVENSVVLSLPTDMEKHLATQSNRRGPVNLKKWKRVARDKTDDVSTQAPKLGKRKDDDATVEKKMTERGEKKLKKFCAQNFSDNPMAEAGSQPRQSP